MARVLCGGCGRPAGAGIDTVVRWSGGGRWERSDRFRQSGGKKEGLGSESCLCSRSGSLRRLCSGRESGSRGPRPTGAGLASGGRGVPARLLLTITRAVAHLTATGTPQCRTGARQSARLARQEASLFFFFDKTRHTSFGIHFSLV